MRGRKASSRARRLSAAAVCVLLLAEIGVRARAASLPDPLRWSSPELQYKAVQIEARARAGGASSVFLGSSVVDVGVDPGRVAHGADARPAYNAAIGGGSISMTALWAERLAVPKLRPSTVVIGLVSRELNPNDPEQATYGKAMLASPAVRHLLGNETALQRAERLAERWSDLFRYRTELRQPRYLANVLGWGDAPRRNTRSSVVTDDGRHLRFAALTDTHDPRVAAYFRANALHDFEIGAAQLTTLRALLRFCAVRARRVLVVAMPVTAEYVALHPHGAADNAAFRAAVSSAAHDAGVDMLDPGVWPDALFADPAHLNARGAEQFSAYLSDALR